MNDIADNNYYNFRLQLTRNTCYSGTENRQGYNHSIRFIII